MYKFLINTGDKRMELVIRIFKSKKNDTVK